MPQFMDVRRQVSRLSCFYTLVNCHSSEACSGAKKKQNGNIIFFIILGITILVACKGQQYKSTGLSGKTKEIL